MAANVLHPLLVAGGMASIKVAAAKGAFVARKNLREQGQDDVYMSDATDFSQQGLGLLFLTTRRRAPGPDTRRSSSCFATCCESPQRTKAVLRSDPVTQVVPRRLRSHRAAANRHPCRQRSGRHAKPALGKLVANLSEQREAVRIHPKRDRQAVRAQPVDRAREFRQRVSFAVASCATRPGPPIRAPAPTRSARTGCPCAPLALPCCPGRFAPARIRVRTLPLDRSCC